MKKSSAAAESMWFSLSGTGVPSGRKLFFWTALLFLFSLCMPIEGGKRAEASSAAISITAQSQKVQVGEVIYVLITVRSADTIQGVEGYFSYDNRYLRYEKGGSLVHGNDDAFRILDVERGIGTKKVMYSVKFTARKAGSSSIRLKKPYAVIAADEKGSKMSVSYSPLNLLVEKKASVKPDKEPSSKAETPPPEEKKDTAKDKTKTGTTDKKKPKQTEEPQTEEPQTEETGEDSGGLQGDAKVKAVVKGGRICLRSLQEVAAAAVDDDAKIPKGFIPEQIKIGGEFVQAYVLQKRPDANYALIYGKEQEAFFLYDKEENTLYPYDKVKSWYQGLSDAELQELETAGRQVKSYQYLLGIMGTFCGLMVLLVTAFWLRTKKYS